MLCFLLCVILAPLYLLRTSWCYTNSVLLIIIIMCLIFVGQVISSEVLYLPHTDHNDFSESLIHCSSMLWYCIVSASCPIIATQCEITGNQEVLRQWVLGIICIFCCFSAVHMVVYYVWYFTTYALLLLI